MEIQWLGHSSFRLRGSTTTIVTDPYASSIGVSFPSVQAGLVTVSHPHPNHGSTRGIQGEAPYVVQTPGEYEMLGTFVRAIATPLKPEAGKGARNLVCYLEMDGLTLVHLGDLGEPLLSRQVDDLSPVDILFVPAGGGCTVTPAQAAEVVNLLEPRLVIPMHYRLDSFRVDLGGLDELLRELGAQDAALQSRLSVTANNLPADRRIAPLEVATVRSGR